MSPEQVRPPYWAEEDAPCWCEDEDAVLNRPCPDCGRAADVRPLHGEETFE